MDSTFLIITSIANSDHPVLKQYAEEAKLHNIPFIVIGDTKSPKDFNLNGCDFYSIGRQKELDWEIAHTLPEKHYARKNLGYLIAMSKGAEVIIETDDDNIPFSTFWKFRKRENNAHIVASNSWVNVYKYFTDVHIWPRGFALSQIMNPLPPKGPVKSILCPIQQGLADENPDVDAIDRMTLPLPLKFDQRENIALGENSWCPFNSQNTTWFKEAFPLLYLPSYCSFRMTDIWRSFIAQRIAWTCGWNILFHNSTVWQKRNDHNLMIDFKDEIPGYLNNDRIVIELQRLNLKNGVENISANLITCYKLMINMNLIDRSELTLVKQWIETINKFKIKKYNYQSL
jgi:hypothetical protein